MSIPIPRVLHVVATLGYGGVAQMLCRYYRAMEKSQLQFDFVSHGGAESFHRDIEAMGGRVFYINTAGQVGLHGYVGSVRRLIRENGAYCTVHAHTNYQAGLVGLAAWLEHVPLRICHIRGVHIDRRNRALLPFYKALMLTTCNMRVACSQQAGTFYYGQRPFRLIHNAVDLGAFQIASTSAMSWRRELAISDATIVLGHVGRFTAEKNHEFLLDVLAKLHAEGQPACLVLAGDGPLRASIEAKASQMGLGRHIRFLGVRKDIPELMRAFDILLLPSFSEGLPNVIVEAQAAGIPSLVSDTITREVDLGLNLVTYAPITKAEQWCKAVPAIAYGPRPPRTRIHHAVHHAGFDLASGVAAMMSLYSGATRARQKDE